MRRFACTFALLAIGSLFIFAQDKPNSKTTARPCVFAVYLPADAELEIEGYPTKSRGGFRLFESPPMPTGKRYVYSLRAIHRGIVVARTIEVTPDKQVEVDLRPDFGISVPSKPPVKPEKKPLSPEEPGKPPALEPETKPSGEKPSVTGSFEIRGFRDTVIPSGGTATLRLQVERKALEGIISLDFGGLPKGVTVNQSTIPAGADHVDLILQATPQAVPGKYQVTVTAKAAGVQKAMKFVILVVEGVKAKPALPPVSKPEDKVSQPEDKKKVSPPEPKKGKSDLPRGKSASQHPFGFLVVSGPDLVTVSPGETTKLFFKVSRKAVLGAVHFRWCHLPSGITAPSKNAEIDADGVTLSLTASADAAPVVRECQLEVSTAGGAVRLQIPIIVEIR